MAKPVKEGAASEELKKMLNEAISNELQVSIQYMWQHVQWKGAKAYAGNDQFKQIAIAEMKHAEMIAERLFYLGGVPTTKPAPIDVGDDDLWRQLDLDKKAEEKTIALYNEIIKLATKEDDVTTRVLFEKILKDEEEHHDWFSSFLDDPEAAKG